MKTYEIDDVVTNDNNESDDLMDIEKEEEHDESDWEYEEEPALTFVGDKPPELEPEVENDQDNGNGVEPDDITIVALNNDKNTDNVFEQPELNFEVNKICEIDSLMMNALLTALLLVEKIVTLLLQLILLCLAI